MADTGKEGAQVKTSETPKEGPLSKTLSDMNNTWQPKAPSGSKSDK